LIDRFEAAELLQASSLEFGKLVGSVGFPKPKKEGKIPNLFDRDDVRDFASKLDWYRLSQLQRTRLFIFVVRQI
jgi:hypothetical protein